MSGPVVDPRAPRVGAAFTAALSLVVVATRSAAASALLAAFLALPLATAWRVDPYGALWRHGLRRFASPPREYAAAIPHRFARAFDALAVALATGPLLLAAITGAPVAPFGYALVGFVGLLAAVGAVTGTHPATRLYRRLDPDRPSALLTAADERST